MEIKGTYSFDAPVSKVWDLLLDPAVVAKCLPGCQELRPIGDDRYHASISVAIAAITGEYQGTVSITDKVPLRSYRLLVDGSGRAGFAKGQSVVTLTEQSGKTIVEVSGDVQVGGAIARVGQRLLSSVSKMLMDRFYGCLREEVDSRQ